MEDPDSTLLPYILETLSRKPELCDTFEHICKEIEEQLIADNNTSYGNVRKALQRALTVGQSLGIITVTNETIRMPFNFRERSVKNTKNGPTAANQQVQKPAFGTRSPVAQNTTERNIVAPSKTPVNRKGPNNLKTHEGYPDFMIRPPMRPRNIRGRSYARKALGARKYSRGRSRRGRKRGRSGYRRRVSRRR
ncbi:uncharacterized protein LOC129247384 isoform X1 [Anastrepha obliqua]|uniref:uncharacterized protein LOC129247384 isoform X1 n=1 Tax=Anastrepha obliqua TaxID=95512 RepID=UPI00240A1A6D|nr:uncharacterized protein LOC129247384 isoform X1 [Anastrepha obliqua]